VFFEACVDGRTVRVEVRARGESYSVSLDGRPVELDAVELNGGFTSLLLDGRSYEVAVEREPDGFRVHFAGGSVHVELADRSRSASLPSRRASGPARLTAPMPGRVVRLLAAQGASVEAGQGVVVVEAMKMENELRAPRAGRVDQVAVREGQAVEAGALLLVIA
jgi:biotin carboxyl carrier protein